MNLLFRTDGNSTIGLGHFVRSLALAEMLQPYYHCSFAIQAPSEAIAEQIQKSGCVLIKLPATTNYISEAEYLAQSYAGQFAAVILDGYQFLTGYQSALRPFFKIICIDDLHTTHFLVDVIINPAGGITPENYAKEAYTKVYTGPAFALLRQPFLKAAQQVRSRPDSPRVFINMGGADPENFTLQVITALLQRPENFKIEVVLGSAYSYLTTLKNSTAHTNQLNLHQGLSAVEMCQLMQQCTFAILPPSTVAYEWCSVGGPLFLIRTAENQKNLERFLLQQHLALPYTQLNNFLPEVLTNTAFFTEQALQQHQQFDGQSPLRLRQVIDQLFYPELLQLRRAQASDVQLLFQWINDPVVRRFSLHPDPIPLNTHTTWFQYKLTDKNCFIFIAEIYREPVGMIRFDVNINNKNEAVISYLIDQNFRGKGLGTLMLQAGLKNLKKAAPQITTVSGLVQPENNASIKAFTKAGFSVESNPDKDYPNILKFTISH
ncbi:UDP-2,4-diacetamido-2,4,6-trideoxy-beta-L-altropyranose hydrolase [Adhaeribacter swui]|uniref:UDP-2,4-diacetamido-2,4, 6-trideoxy-beta-L-altropyranose hydrolase n=1 Tax=Adhaeribacter swui TaxID=2086471 RepID=A0A7G7GAK8_9BACT|nr:UDP-2,4-diacetamido-2,4,6-trideoxy-beta-L-altropyranose hydrolase [Adhaeribacter swui]QNF34192.1 UDP-2,4-diacetamido-2,4,6-trideoxy-beta-L-altropyranose hydrolase [Adhaeribacter swui]